ncbi:MAG: hypothetical protein R6U10_00175 [Thermoplasmatota archaeon]
MATGVGLMLLGALGLASDVPPGDVLSRYLPDGALVVLLAAGAIVLVAGLLPRRLMDSDPGDDFSSMKRCHGCGKMVPPDTIRCPNCNAKFTSLYDNL